MWALEHVMTSPPFPVQVLSQNILLHSHNSLINQPVLFTFVIWSNQKTKGIIYRLAGGTIHTTCRQAHITAATYRKISEGFNMIVFSSSNLFLFIQYDTIPVLVI